MELLEHLGILVAPSPTIESILYKARGLVTLWILFNMCFWYHWLSFWMLITALFFPDLAEFVKRGSSYVFWSACLLLSELNRVKIEVTGDEMDPFLAVIIANHQLLADYVVLTALAHKLKAQAKLAGKCRSEAVPQVNFFTWFTLARAPTVKALCNLARCDENWELAQLQSDRVFRRVRDSEGPEWVVVFPEVNIWTSRTAYLQSIQAQKYFLPALSRVLYPRFSSFANTMALLRGEIGPKRALKFTLLYDVLIVHSKPVTLLEFFSCKEPHTVTIHVKQRSLEKVPLKRQKMDKWLERTWVDKNKLVGSLHHSSCIK